MQRFFLKCLSILFLALFTVGQAQDEIPVPTPEKVEQQPSSNLFENMDAPVTYKGAFAKMMLTLLALIVLIVISVWMLRRISSGRMKQMNYGRSIKVLERRPLSAKSILYLVEISGKRVVIAESQIEVRAIPIADHLTTEEE